CPGVDLKTDDAKVLYIDNFAVLSSSPGRAATAAKAMQSALAARGVVSELDPDSCERGELLGCELDLRTGCWQVLGRRLWRIYGALGHALGKRARVTGQELERLIGHLVSLLMLRRGDLAMLHASYEFARASYTKRQPLWKSVRRELAWVKSLLPCLRAGTTLPWSDVVTCFDASPWGYGIVEAEWDLDSVQRVGRVSERTRFRGLLAAEGAPRERALEQDIARAPGPALLPAGRAAGFPEVDYEKMQAQPWRVAGCGRWKRKEAIHGLEGAALTWAVRRAARGARQRGSRRLFLGDNMSLTLAAAKGRAAYHRLLGVCRVIFAIGVAADMKMQVRPDLAGRRARLGRVRLASDFDQRRRQLCPRQTRLAAAKVRPHTQELCLGTVLGLVRWLGLECLLDWPRQTWDEVLAGYAKAIYNRGSSNGKPLSGLAVLTMFETYMWPSEVLALRARQVVLPLPKEGGASVFMTFVVRASELQVPTKTNEYDISVPLDLQRQQWLVESISFVQALREPDVLVLGLSYTELAADFSSAISALGVTVLKPTLYSLRHGGASHDASTGARSLGAVQQREGWKAFKSVLRYEEHGRLSMELRKLSDHPRDALRAAGLVHIGVFNRSWVRHFAARRISPEFAW
ncbi:unnamed protein product, partial [Prorocentrum cordatum]